MSHFIDAEIHGLAGKTSPTKTVFDRHLTIIYELNGSGKTSLLRILHSAMTGDAASLRNVPFSSATVRFWSAFNQATYTRTIDKSMVGEPVATTTRMPPPTRQAGILRRLASKPERGWTETVEQDGLFDSIGPKKGESELDSFDHRYLPTTRLYVGAPQEQMSLWGNVSLASVGTGTSLTEETLDKNFADALGSLWTSYTSEVGRSVRAAQAKGLANILKAVMSGPKSTLAAEPSLDLQRAYESVKQFLERQGSPAVLGTFAKFSNRYESDQSLQAVVHDIYSVEREVERATEPQRQLERLVHRLYSGNKRVIFTEESILVESITGERIGLESLSSGEKHLIRMFVECLGAGPNAILIDEPEISVHIDWQRELMEILHSLNKDAQFIVATHSPEIMAEIADERLLSL